MVRVEGKHKSMQNNLPAKFSFNLNLATWKEISVYRNVCLHKTVVERHTGIAWLYEVIMPEMRRVLVLAVTMISTNDLDLGYYWSRISVYEIHLHVMVPHSTAPCHCILALCWRSHFQAGGSMDPLPLSI